ncbi:MAG: hypothetical protein JXI33_02990 [Candidatus Aminicenantes bacterium]|nr:hypothetical protein [Candidatus Aminicenantes bacterium]
MSIKFNYSDSQAKQNGRFHMRFDERNAKFILFNPLNHVALQLQVAGEKALLSRPGQKLYWRGDFSLLLDRLWGIELTVAELKEIILSGALPQAKIREKGMVVDLEHNPDSQVPQTIKIRQNHAELILKILKNETRPGNIILLERLPGYKKAELEGILDHD